MVATVVVGLWEAHWFVAPTAAGGSEAMVQGVREGPTEITARGRLEPKDRVVKVAGPSQPAVFVNVIHQLYVKEGDAVTAGQVIGIFDRFRLASSSCNRDPTRKPFATRSRPRSHATWRC
jgi:multidrug efflux pump subunit AcrA (membrane-fusion protein)